MKPRSIRCMKFIITLFNIVCILIGLILITVCAINLKERKSAEHTNVSRGVLSFILTLGLCLVVTAVLGCVGALREHTKTLYVHACFLIFLVTIELLVGIGGAVLSAWVGSTNELRTEFYRNSTTADDVAQYQSYWDNLQSENKCCGVDGPQDFAMIHREIPVSCCVRAYPLREGGARRQIHANCINEKSYYKQGCDTVLKEKRAFKGHIFISSAVIFLLIELICIIFALWMARAIRSERRKLQQNLQAHFET